MESVDGFVPRPIFADNQRCGKHDALHTIQGLRNENGARCWLEIGK